MLKYFSLRKTLHASVFVILVSILFPFSFAYAQDVVPGFTYTHPPTQNGILPIGSTWELHGIYGVNICPGDSGPIGYQIYYSDYTNTGRSLAGDRPALNQPIDVVITPGPGMYQDLRILCLDSNTVMHLGDTFAVSSMPIITTAPQLPEAYAGTLYSTTLAYSISPGEYNSFPTPPYTWTVINGSLPRGLSLDPLTGTISGKPLHTASATSTFTVQLQDVFGKTDTKIFTLPVIGKSTRTTVTTPKLRVCVVSPRRGQVGVNYSKNIAVASGGVAPYTWSLAGGALPSGLALDSATGVISGIPTLAGTSSVTIRVDDSSSQSLLKTFMLRILPADKVNC